MISNSILFDGYELKSFELALYFRDKWSDAQCGRKDLKKKKQIMSNFGIERKIRHIHTEPHCPISPSFVRSRKINQK